MLPLFICHILKLSTFFFLSLTEIPYFEFSHLFWFRIRVGCAPSFIIPFHSCACVLSLSLRIRKRKRRRKSLCPCACVCEANSVYGSFGMFSTHAQTWSHAVWPTRTSEMILSSFQQMKIGQKEIRFSLVRCVFGTTLENSL